MQTAYKLAFLPTAIAPLVAAGRWGAFPLLPTAVFASYLLPLFYWWAAEQGGRRGWLSAQGAGARRLLLAAGPPACDRAPLRRRCGAPASLPLPQPARSTPWSYLFGGTFGKGTGTTAGFPASAGAGGTKAD